MSGTELVRAAQYVRMSTEHQNYSLEYQSVCNAAYGLERGMTIVQTYTDAGISGVRLDKREGLKRLLADVLGGAADFTVVLVYDVSRWGRFQDPDESAHYEFMCRAAGVSIVYTAEPFASDGSIASTLVKQLKRAMAAEYSRELSAKVSRAKRGLTEKGYWCGGVCSYGFRRGVVTPAGVLKLVLGDGERKALLGHRIVLVAGPDQEVEVVRRIFREFALKGLSTTTISRHLNEEGVPSNQGERWTRNRIWRLLTDEKYVGTLVAGRRKAPLAREEVIPRDRWIRVRGACPPLVEHALYDLAQANIRRSERAPSDEELIDDLRQLLQLRGTLSANTIRDSGKHEPALYKRRFGSLTAAYDKAGYQPTRRQLAAAARYTSAFRHGRLHDVADTELIEGLRRLYQDKGRLTSALIDEQPDLPSSTTCCKRLGDMMRLCELAGCTPTKRQTTGYKQNARRRTLVDVALPRWSSEI